MATNTMHEYKRIMEIIGNLRLTVQLSSEEKGYLDEARKAISEAMAINRSQG
jgi:hypothetical protein